ncbi:MAG: hypothetical protein COA99_14130 [Moraxellaceae bacterium]|nr:MAG: hypothetical protein COA99_14130 [Moraxellaceae bacterium]
MPIRKFFIAFAVILLAGCGSDSSRHDENNPTREITAEVEEKAAPLDIFNGVWDASAYLSNLDLEEYSYLYVVLSPNGAVDVYAMPMFQNCFEKRSADAVISGTTNGTYVATEVGTSNSLEGTVRFNDNDDMIVTRVGGDSNITFIYTDLRLADLTSMLCDEQPQQKKLNTYIANRFM